MKIAMIGQKSVVNNEYTGGIEKHVLEISERLVEFGHDVTVYSRAKYMPLMPQSYRGIKLKFIPTIYSKNFETIIHSFFATINSLFNHYDVIHYHGVGSATLAWISRLFSRQSTIIVTFHSQDRFHRKWSLLARLYLYFGEWASVTFSHYCIAVSHTLQVFIRDHYKKEAVFIPNGAEIKSVQGSNLIDKFNLLSKKYLLNVGRIVPQKGLQLLIKAFSEIKTDFHLVFVGGAGFSKEYYAQLRELSSNNHRIHFLGFQDDKILDQLYANAYLYIQPSESEGLALVILEAMSFGVTPLVSDIPANVEAIHGAGFTFASGDVEDLKFKLEYLLKNEIAVKNQSEEVLAIVDMYFNWDVIAKKIESIYITSRH